MKKFLFRLEPVLKQRLLREEQAILEFAEAQREYFRELQRLEEVNASFERAVGEAGEKADGIDVINKSLYIEYLKNSLLKCHIFVEKSSGKMEKKRAAMADARKDRLVMEKLKQNQYLRFINDLNAAEQKILDEIGTLQYARKRA
ncbi:flagellar protein FliJ [Desulfocucumis palustris]|uniref:Flagellar FliJ protein n=1 Tax=Desulfocucumis palustris TaxID=1898651 RepID=A0A2L2XAU2_9FIRM|nr:flagellar export protein FliJ [Desulfocucumis palustris]GBF33192.1 flagellar protein FliJ [Desulfocucumis palustris]